MGFIMKFITWLFTPAIKLLNSFDNHTKNSYSGRKLTTFAFVVMTGYVVYGYVEHHIEHKFQDVFWVLIALIVGAFIGLGLITIPQLIQILNTKNGNKDEVKEENKTIEENTDSSSEEKRD